MKKWLPILLFVAACGRGEFGSATAADDVVSPSESGAEFDGNANDEEANDQQSLNNANNADSNNGFDPSVEGRSTTPGLDIIFPYAALAERSGNFVFSPHALDKSLLVLHTATSGATTDEFSSALGISDRESAYAAFAARDEQVQSVAPQFSEVGVWIDSPFAVEQFFVDQVDAYFDVTVRRVNLQEIEDARVQINNTVRSETEGFVSETLPPTVLDMGDFVVAGGTYFDAPWLMPFHPDDVELAAFADTNDREFMSKFGTFLQHEDETLRAVALPLDNGHSVVLMMPKGDRLAQFEQDLSRDFIFRFIDELSLAETRVLVPTIDVSTHVDLSKDAAAMGLDFLTQNAPRFDDIGADAELGAFVQFSRLTLNDNGVQTTDIDGENANAIALRFDQPFVFAVLDLSNRSILYLGRIIE